MLNVNYKTLKVCLDCHLLKNCQTKLILIVLLFEGSGANSFGGSFTNSAAAHIGTALLVSTVGTY